MNIKSEDNSSKMGPPQVKLEKNSINYHTKCTKWKCNVGNRLNNCPISDLPPLPDNTSEKSNKRPLDKQTSESPFKMLRMSKYIGQCPNKMILMLFDINNKKPFMLTVDITSSSYHIFSILKWSKYKNIQFEYITEDTHIVMYAYSFIEKDFIHPPTYCNKKHAEEAMDECKKQGLTPFKSKKDERTQADTANDTANDTLSKYSCLNNKVIKVLVFDNVLTKIIKFNVLVNHFIHKIINKMKERDETIELKGIGRIIDIRDANQYEKLMFSFLGDII
jgi:hypothetical protein